MRDNVVAEADCREFDKNVLHRVQVGCRVTAERGMYYRLSSIWKLEKPLLLPCILRQIKWAQMLFHLFRAAPFVKYFFFPLAISTGHGYPSTLF